MCTGQRFFTTPIVQPILWLFRVHYSRFGPSAKIMFLDVSAIDLTVFWILLVPPIICLP